MSQKKMFILDTNILLHDPTSIFNFGEAFIGIPAVVLEELDTFKKEGTDRGRNSREVIRQLDALRAAGSLHDGVKMANGGTLKILFGEKTPPASAFKIHLEDNEILMAALTAKSEGYQVVFISKDLNARIKADALGLDTEDYLKEYITEDEFYHGWIRIQVPAVQLKKEFPSELDDVVKEYKLVQNEFVLVESQHNPFNYRLFRYLGSGHFKAVYDPQIQWPLKARNPQQLMALDLLFDDNIKLVCLFGPAGTGKTFLALLAGLHKVLVSDDYEKILISRPVVPLGRDIGYLPGTMEEKLHSWMLPVYDNMEFIIHTVNMARHFQELGQEQYSRKNKMKKYDKKDGKRERDGLSSVHDLVHQGKLSMEAITYMRGRSIPYQFIIIDEVQNLTPHEVKTLVTRVGEGSKIILAGDPYQIDSPYLDFASNGLVITSERFKGQNLFGSVFLEHSERSELSQLAGKLL
jgi:PhoH-like ATPase